MPARTLEKKPKILYIEDNRENRMLVRAVLEASGYTIVEAEDGLAGIEAAIREEPALILLDINLPGVDGYEIVAILKSFPNLASTPVIAVTAYAMQGDRQRTLVAGCDGYIQKPINVDVFPRQVAEFLGGKRERVEGREEGVYLRELNQRLVYRLLNQVEELKRLNQHFVRRASQLADLHHAVQGITSELGVAEMLERLLLAVAQAIGTTSLRVELTDPPGVQVVARGDTGDQPRSVLAGAGVEPADEWTEVEWTLPLTVRGRELGVMVARHVMPPGAKADEEQLLKIVADQVAIAVENARLYERVTRRAAEQESLVEAGRLLTGTLQVSEVLQRLSELVRARLGADVVRILIAEDAPGHFRLEAQAGTTRTPKLSAQHAADDDDGLVGWIVKHRAALALSDVLPRPGVGYRDWLRSEGFVSFLGLPLFLENQLVGILTVWYREPHTFAPDEVALGEALATSATAAIRNARLYEETQERLRHTETLLAVSYDTSSTLELAEVLRRTTRAMVRALGANTGGAWLVTPGKDRFVPIVGYHVPKDALQTFATTEIVMTDQMLKEWGRYERAVYSSDSGSDPRFAHPITRLLPHTSLLIQPMRWKGETIGGFAIAWRTDAGGARPDPGGSGPRARYRARPPPLQPATRVRPADDRPQRGARADAHHGASPGRVRRDHPRRGVRARAPARRSGCAAHQAGVPEPHQQRRLRHEGRWVADDPVVRRRRHSPGRSHRHRHRHPGGAPRPDLRAVLHHETRRERHGPRPAGQPRDRPESRRHHRGQERARAWLELHRQASGKAERRRH